MDVRGWVDEGQVCVALGDVVVRLGEGDAYELKDVVERGLRVLDPPEYDCEFCYDTGDRWIPMAPGAVTKTTCDCAGTPAPSAPRTAAR